MNRRNAIKQTALVIGGTTISTSLLTGLLTSCQPEPGITWTPVFLDENEGATLTRALDTLIPTTDTPGALDAGVPEFLDKLAKDYLPKEDQEKFRAGLAKMNADSEEKYGKSFAKASKEQQTELITQYDNEAFGENPKDDEAIEFYRDFKSSAGWAFCTSERGAKEHLQFVFDPGSYTGCVPLAEVGGKNWIYP